MKEDPETVTFDEIYTRKIGDDVQDFLDKSNDKDIQELNELTPLKIRWHYMLYYIYSHIASVYGLYLIFTETKWQTLVFVAVLDLLSILSITAGVHRLWCHRSYKATLPLRIFLAIVFTLSMEHSIPRWVLDHRMHHKYSETNADPHNAKRGFLYSHIFWLFAYETDDYFRKCPTIDMSDVMADPVARFQWKYFYYLLGVISFILPTIIPMWMWGETFYSAHIVAVLLRLVITHHQTYIVNSFAHMYGFKPYDVNIYPTENKLVAFLTEGEGFHNYHHTFPWDYAASEFRIKYNLTTIFIDVMAWLGLASDRKTAPKSLIESRKRRTGESSLQQLQSTKTDTAEKVSKKE